MKKMPYGLRKYLRREKARIRKTINDAAEARKAIEALYGRIKRL